VSVVGQIIQNNGKQLRASQFSQRFTRKAAFETRLRALIDASKAINQPQSLHEVLTQVVNHALRAFPQANRGAIHLYDETSQQLFLKDHLI